VSARRTDFTVEDALRGAWQTLLRGDTATRDRLCDAAMAAFKPGETNIPADRSVPLDGLRGATVEGTFEEVPGVIYLPGPKP
jgi:hypothetical protein